MKNTLKNMVTVHHILRNIGEDLYEYSNGSNIGSKQFKMKYSKLKLL
jgi:hypothetical protein